MKIINYIRNKLRKAKKAEVPKEPLLVGRPPSDDRDWQAVDSREGSQSGHEGDWSGRLHQRAPTPALEESGPGVLSQTWDLFREYVGKLLKTEPRASRKHAATGAHQRQ